MEHITDDVVVCYVFHVPCSMILVINGPNLNLLGKRSSKHYGSLTLNQINNKIRRLAQKLGLKVLFFQSNYEGKLIDFIQQEFPQAQGIIINPGALSHYSYALLDALRDSNLPVVEVHLSDISKREAWRRKSVTAGAAVKIIKGKKEKGYEEALEYLANKVRPYWKQL